MSARFRAFRIFRTGFPFPSRRFVRNFGIIRPMKVLPALLVFTRTALGVTVPPLPFDVAVLTEATTNIPFKVDFGTMSRIEFTLALDASPTNFVEVAIGTDTNGDGVLGLDEDSLSLGFDCGRWFGFAAADERQTEEAAPTTGQAKRTLRLKRPKMDEAWNLVRVTRRGAAKGGEVVVVEGSRPGVVMEIR